MKSRKRQQQQQQQQPPSPPPRQQQPPPPSFSSFTSLPLRAYVHPRLVVCVIFFYIAFGVVSLSILIDFGPCGRRARDAAAAAAANKDGNSKKDGIEWVPSTVHPMTALIRSYPNRGDRDDPYQRRNCLSFTSTPGDLKALASVVNDMVLRYPPYLKLFDCIHLSIPEIALRYKDQAFPTTAELRKTFRHEKIIIHRMADFGPMARFVGPVSYEKHPETAVVLFDVDSIKNHKLFNDGSIDQYWSGQRTHPGKDEIGKLVYASRNIDTDSLWCNLGENFQVDIETWKAQPAWDTFSLQTTPDKRHSWNQVHFCRGSAGYLFKVKHFADFWYNQTDYHLGCFWDDDRWVSYQMERQGFQRKVIHPFEYPPETANINNNNQTAKTAVAAGPAVAAAGRRYNHTPSARLRPRKPVSSSARIRRRLGSLTKVHITELQSMQTCMKAWMTAHMDQFPEARVNGTAMAILAAAAQQKKKKGDKNNKAKVDDGDTDDDDDKKDKAKNSKDDGDDSGINDKKDSSKRTEAAKKLMAIQRRQPLLQKFHKNEQQNQPAPPASEAILSLHEQQKRPPQNARIETKNNAALPPNPPPQQQQQQQQREQLPRQQKHTTAAAS